VVLMVSGGIRRWYGLGVRTSDDDRRQAPFRDRNVVVRGQFATVSGLDDDHVDAGEYFSQDHAEEWELMNFVSKRYRSHALLRYLTPPTPWFIP